jgi:hypothetical protein
MLENVSLRKYIKKKILNSYASRLIYKKMKSETLVSISLREAINKKEISFPTGFTYIPSQPPQFNAPLKSAVMDLLHFLDINFLPFYNIDD